MTDERLMTRYLLGQLDADAQADLDERAFVDDAWAEESAAAADELIEGYLAGALDPGARQAFEAHFLSSPAHRERFELLRDLGTVVARRATGTPPAVREPRRVATLLWAAAAALALAALAAALLSRRTPPDPGVASATPAPTVAPAPTTPPRTRTASVRVPAQPRPLEVAVASDVRTVRFAIPVPDANAPSYSAAILRDGEPVWRRDDLVPREAGAPVEVDVPADVLAAGDAVLSVEAEATRAGEAPPAAARRWPLRVTVP